MLISTDSLAEGLNLHQRCFHLIHLDLPYNPNRLEQRNGRIDRYGQQHDPEIRYLFLAGTFEERLLLRLIAKYEKARACLGFMPNTLGVGADPASLAETLFSGFAEDLFSAVPRLIHSLDLAAEDTGSDAYRDLLREIDRAFQSFDHMAVRHGWLSGGEASDPPSNPVATEIDLPAFVASTVPERLPPAWCADLDGLPGFDRTAGKVRLSNDPAQVRDAQGRTLLYPGRSHPLTRRAIASVRSGRVSAARADRLSLLITYAVDAGAAMNRIFALRVFPDGSFAEQGDFLSLGRKGVKQAGLWQRLFADWAPDAMAAASGHAAFLAGQIAADVATVHRFRVERDRTAMEAWLLQRANELCGKLVRQTADLFACSPPDEDWRSCSAPEQRLTGFVADPAVPLPQRREAADVLSKLRTQPAAFPPFTVRMLGLLMLVP